jgi:hypothetical protein
MSKRVANCRSRKTARFGRVRYGWRVVKAATDLQSVNDKLEQQEMDGDMRQKFEEVKSKLRSFIPKRLLRRTQRR